MPRPRLIVGVALGVLVATGPSAVLAAGFSGPQVQPESDGKTAAVAITYNARMEPLHAPVLVHSAKPAAGRRWTCRLYNDERTDESGGIESGEMMPAERPEAGEEYLLACEDENGNEPIEPRYIVYNPAQPASMFADEARPALLLDRALRTLATGPVPAIRTSPPKDRDQIVGIQTWYWIDAWTPVARPPETDGVYTVVLTIGPTELEVDPGDGTGRITCTASTAKPWVEGGARTSTCGHTYHRSSTHRDARTAVDGRYVVRARLTYGVSYRVTGPGGYVAADTVPAITSDWSADPLMVKAYEAVIR